LVKLEAVIVADPVIPMLLTEQTFCDKTHAAVAFASSRAKPKGIPMPKSVKNRARKPETARAAASSVSPVIALNSDHKKKGGKGSKQSRVITMLKSVDGTTIAAMMKATGWQQHSVRGFLAGVVRKKLRLKLNSNKIDGKRIYRVVGGTGSNAGGQQSRHHSP
jgi:hypothetical protein